MSRQADGWMVELYCDDGEWRPVGEPIATRGRFWMQVFAAHCVDVGLTALSRAIHSCDSASSAK